jgi:DNA-binding NtrC family response regulator
MIFLYWRFTFLECIVRNIINPQENQYSGTGKLSNYPWPGNIRELQHSIEKAVILSDSSVLGPADFSFNTLSKGAGRQ